MIQPGVQTASVSAVKDNIFEQILDVSALRSATIQVSGTFVLSLIIEVSNDPGATQGNWNAIAVIPANGSAAVNEITTAGIYVAPLGYRAMRLRCSVFTSGEAEIEAIFSKDPAPGALAFQGNPSERFKISDLDDSGSLQYYGYLDESGRWYIMRFDTSTKELRYARGESDYGTGWTDRASLTYGYFNNIF